MRTALALLAGLVALVFLIWRKRRAQGLLAEARSHLFDDCLDLFATPRLSQTGIEYPRLVGFVRGAEIQVTPLIDTLTVRKLPSLWLLVTLAKPTPLTATIDLMMRPSGTEGFSNFHRLAEGVETPPGWPERAVIRTDDASGVPPAAVLTRHMAIFDNPDAKELLISPKGVRIVVQADEAKRTQYLVLRQAEFAIERLDRGFLVRLLDRLFEIHEDLERWRKQPR